RRSSVAFGPGRRLDVLWTEDRRLTTDDAALINRILLMRISRLALIASLLPVALHAQDVTGVRLGLMYQPEYQPGLVVLPFGAEAGAERAVPGIRSIIRQDMDFSDRFTMMSDPAPSEIADGVNLPL